MRVSERWSATLEATRLRSHSTVFLTLFFSDRRVFGITEELETVCVTFTELSTVVCYVRSDNWRYIISLVIETGCDIMHLT